MPSKMGAASLIEVEGTPPIGVGEGAIKAIIMEDRITTIMGTKIPMATRIITMEEAVVAVAGAVGGMVEVGKMAMGTLQSSGEVVRSSKTQRYRHHQQRSLLMLPLK